jgi:hypothetical protein
VTNLWHISFYLIIFTVLTLHCLFFINISHYFAVHVLCSRVGHRSFLTSVTVQDSYRLLHSTSYLAVTATVFRSVTMPSARHVISKVSSIKHNIHLIDALFKAHCTFIRNLSCRLFVKLSLTVRALQHVGRRLQFSD